MTNELEQLKKQLGDFALWLARNGMSEAALIRRTIAQLEQHNTKPSAVDGAKPAVSDATFEELLETVVNDAYAIAFSINGSPEKVLADPACEALRQYVHAPQSPSNLSAWYGMDRPWPLHDVLASLVDGVGILLDDKSYDGHGHESLRVAQRRGAEILATILASPQPQAASTEPCAHAEPVEDCHRCEWVTQYFVRQNERNEKKLFAEAASKELTSEGPTPWGHELWAHLDSHGLVLVQSELQEVVDIALRVAAPASALTREAVEPAFYVLKDDADAIMADSYDEGLPDGVETTLLRCAPDVGVWIPLYASPPQVPTPIALSEQEWHDIYLKTTGCEKFDDFLIHARAIERKLQDSQPWQQ
jgi:hypothetical protein